MERKRQRWIACLHNKRPSSLFLCPYSMAFPHRLLLIALFPQTHFQFFLNVSNCAPKLLNCLLKAERGMGILGRQFITISFVWEHVSSERTGRGFFDECLLIKMTVMFSAKKVSFHIRKAEHLPSKNSPLLSPSGPCFYSKEKAARKPQMNGCRTPPSRLWSVISNICSLLKTWQLGEAGKENAVTH